MVEFTPWIISTGGGTAVFEFSEGLRRIALGIGQKRLIKANLARIARLGDDMLEFPQPGA